MGRAGAGVLIDTSALVQHFRRRARLHDVVRDHPAVYLSVITVYELEYGARRAGRLSDLRAFQEAFRAEILPLGPEEAKRAAELNASLASANRRIGDRDALIAGTALHHDLPVATFNAEELRRVPGLTVIVPP